LGGEEGKGEVDRAAKEKKLAVRGGQERLKKKEKKTTRDTQSPVSQIFLTNCGKGRERGMSKGRIFPQGQGRESRGQSKNQKKKRKRKGLKNGPGLTAKPSNQGPGCGTPSREDKNREGK